MRKLFFALLLAVTVCIAAAAQRPGAPPPPGGPPNPRGPLGPGPLGPGPTPRAPRDPDRPGPGPRHPGEPPGPRPPLGPGADFLSSEMRFGDRLVKGSPYSAEFSTELTQVLADGTRITRKSSGSVYRSSEGRTRREQTLNAVGPVPIEGEPKQLVLINDPVAGAHYALDPEQHTAHRLPFRADGPPKNERPSEFGPPSDPVKTESLGKEIIEGVEAKGTRTIRTIPAGRIGNDRALEIISERWYSPDLQVVVLSKHKDPFAGETIYRLTNINRTEPAPSLFEVPNGYEIINDRPPVRNE